MTLETLARPASSAAALAAARTALTTALEALKVEISDYPSPISGCDAQFNHLLAQRRQVESALSALDEAIHIPTPRAP